MADWNQWLNQTNQAPGMGFNPMGGPPQPGGPGFAPVSFGGGEPPPGGQPPGPSAPPPGINPNAPLQPVGQINPASLPQLAKPQKKMVGGDLTGSDRAQMDLYSAMVGLQPGDQEISRQRAMADQLRQGAGMPGMRQAGRVQQAANPMEFLSSLAHAGGAAYKGSQADTAQKDQDAKRLAELEAFRIRQGF